MEPMDDPSQTSLDILNFILEVLQKAGGNHNKIESRGTLLGIDRLICTPDKQEEEA